MNRNIYIIMCCLALFLGGSCKEDYVDPDFFGNLEGQVLNNDDLAPLGNVVVQISPSSTTVLTDADGKFRFENLPIGGYTLEVRKEGFEQELLSVELFNSKTTTINILLLPDLSPNTAPTAPSIVSPANMATGLAASSVSLVWQATDVDAEDELTYTVLFFKQGETTQTPIAEGTKDTTLVVEDLDYGSTYYWQVIVDDGGAAPVNGPIWAFTTMDFPQHRLRWIRKVDGVFQVFSSDMNNSPIQVSNSLIGAWRPKLSPDRQQIAFLSSDGIATHLFVMDVDGSNLQQLTSVPVAGVDMMEVDFCWSPNSNTLLYPSNDKLFSVSRTGTDLQVVANAPMGMQFASVDWAEIGNSKVVRITGNNVYQSEIHLIDGNNAWSLLVADEPGRTGNPVFSLEGTKILYTHDVAGFQNLAGRQLDSHIFLLDIATGLTTDLSTGKLAGTNDLDPDFSPTGSEVIFTNTPNDGISLKTLYKATVAGQSRSAILENAEMGDWH